MDTLAQTPARPITFRRAKGRNYLDFLSEMHAGLAPAWYLEIGTNTGLSLARSRTRSIAVDPEFKINQNVFGNKPEVHLFQKTSDAFFADGHIAALGAKIDLAFLDGLHWYEFLLRDFINTEYHVTEGAYAVLHDCIPWTSEMVDRDYTKFVGKAWTGDVWKVVPILQKYRPDLQLRVFDAKPSGLVVITGMDPANRILADHYDEIISEFDGYNDLAGYLDTLPIENTARSPWVT